MNCRLLVRPYPNATPPMVQLFLVEIVGKPMITSGRMFGELAPWTAEEVVKMFESLGVKVIRETAREWETEPRVMESELEVPSIPESLF